MCFSSRLQGGDFLEKKNAADCFWRSCNLSHRLKRIEKRSDLGSEMREIPCSKIAFAGNSLTFLKVGNINSLIRPKIYYLTFTTSKKRTILLVLKTVLFFCPCGKAHEGSTKKKKSFSRWDIPNSFFVAVGGKSRRRCPLVKYSPLGGKTNAESPII